MPCRTTDNTTPCCAAGNNCRTRSSWDATGNSARCPAFETRSPHILDNSFKKINRFFKIPSCEIFRIPDYEMKDKSIHILYFEFFLWTYLAFPSVLRDGRHDRPQTECVISFVTSITNQHLVIVTRLPGKNFKSITKITNGIVSTAGHILRHKPGITQVVDIDHFGRLPGRGILFSIST